MAKNLDQESAFCLEATGIYSLGLAKFLYQQSQKVVVANPIKSHAFVKMEMSRTKTDKADAMSIARYKTKGTRNEERRFLTSE